MFHRIVLIKITAMPLKYQFSKRANIRGGLNFAMFAVDDFFREMKTTAINLQQFWL